jgi:hypothetical protein
MLIGSALRTSYFLLFGVFRFAESAIIEKQKMNFFASFASRANGYERAVSCI